MHDDVLTMILASLDVANSPIKVVEQQEPCDNSSGVVIEVNGCLFDLTIMDHEEVSE